MTETSYVTETDAVMKALQAYMNGARSGKGADMKSTFHPDATIFGYVGTDLFAGPIQNLYDWNDQNGPAKGVEFRISSMDITGSCASVRIDVDDWTGHRFTDYFNLVKFGDQWKVVSKVFFLHH
ncbi:MAG: nuclear transport factor 2 family protein [Aestuariivirga sp.]|nr:nuclear transport factor 2 family protein [Aestuariivirga sp.]